MSHLCNAISASNSSDSSQIEVPLNFQKFDKLIDELMKETSDAEDDLLRKASFVADIDVAICVNSDNLTQLNENLNKCKSVLSNVESEIDEQNEMLQKITNIVCRLNEKLDPTVSTSELQSDTSLFLEHIKTSESQLKHATANFDNIGNLIAEEVLPYKRRATQELIVSILNQHLDVLLYMHHNLERLCENCRSVEEQLAIVRRKPSQLFDG